MMQTLKAPNIEGDMGTILKQIDIKGFSSLSALLSFSLSFYSRVWSQVRALLPLLFSLK